MEKKQNVPALRFQGFSGEWEKTTVGKIFEVTRGETLAAPKTSPTQNPVMNYPVYSSQTKNNGLMGYYSEYLFENAITWTTDGANAGTVRFRKGKFYCTNVCGVLLSKQGYANTFMAEALNKVAWKHVSKVGNPKLMNNVMKEISIHAPKTIDEQNELAEYIEKLDLNIFNRMQKIRKLQQFRQAMLAKLFPREGAAEPELRFRGFSGKWEQCTAKKIFESKDDRNHPDLPVLTATQEYGMVRRDRINYNVGHDKRNEVGYKRVLPGQFVIHLRSFQGGFAHSPLEGIISPAYTVMAFRDEEKHDEYFWKYVFLSESFINRLSTVTYGIRDGRSISFEDFGGLQLCFPSKEEQAKIGAVLRKIDSFISLQQKKLERMQRLKAALLEKLFV